MKILITFLILLCIFSCSSEKNGNDLITIDLQKTIQDERDIPISQFVEDLKYIPLEITPESALSPGIRLQLTEEYIIVRNYSQNGLLLFERETGKFIRQIGKLGRGPTEYLRPLDQFYNPFDQKIYTSGENSIKTYNLKGEFLGSFEKPKIDEYSRPIDAFIDKETYLCYAGSSTTRLAIFNKDSARKSYPQYQKWSKEEVLNNQSPIFFSWENKVSFKERSNDTVFYVSAERLTPRFILFSGDSRYPFTLTRKEALEQMTKPADYIETLNLFENSRYFFFDLVTGYKPETYKSIRNFCVLDKISKKMIVCRNDSENFTSGFNDNINDFLPITPITVTDNNELIAVLQPLDIVNWKKENLVKLSGLISKLPWLEKISELDNPVIVVGRVKD